MESVARMIVSAVSLQKQVLETPALANDAETMQSQEKRLRPVVDGMGVIAKSEDV